MCERKKRARKERRRKKITKAETKWTEARQKSRALHRSSSAVACGLNQSAKCFLEVPSADAQVASITSQCSCHLKIERGEIVRMREEERNPARH